MDFRFHRCLVAYYFFSLQPHRFQIVAWCSHWLSKPSFAISLLSGFYHLIPSWDADPTKSVSCRWKAQIKSPFFLRSDHSFVSRYTTTLRRKSTKDMLIPFTMFTKKSHMSHKHYNIRLSFEQAWFVAHESSSIKIFQPWLQRLGRERAWAMVSAGGRHTVLLRSDGRAVAFGMNGYGQCDLPPLEEGMSYTQVSAGRYHTVLLRSDGSAVACGRNDSGQCNVPLFPNRERASYTYVSAGVEHTVLLCSDGSAVICGANCPVPCKIPLLYPRSSYVQVSVGRDQTMLLCNDGSALIWGVNRHGQCTFQPVSRGPSYQYTQYTQASAGNEHTVLLRSDGHAVTFGCNRFGQRNVPTVEPGISYTQVSAGMFHSVFLRSDGHAVVCGLNEDQQCNIPLLPEGISYTQVSAGSFHTVILRSDGHAVAFGCNDSGQCDIPFLEPGMSYVGDCRPLGKDLVLQLEFLCEDDDDAVTLICSNLAGKELLCLKAAGFDLAMDTHRHIAHELKVDLRNLQVILPDGELLASLYQANPFATVGDVSEIYKHLT